MGFGLLNFGEFCVDDGDRLGFAGDVGMLGLELGEEGLQVCDRTSHFWVTGILGLDTDDVSRVILDDLVGLGVDGVFGGFRHGFYLGLSGFCVGLEFFDDGADFVCGYVILVRFGVEVE